MRHHAASDFAADRGSSVINRNEAKAAAGKEFAIATANAFVTDGSMHPGTVTAAAARMAGTYLFRSFKLRLKGVPPGQAVLSQPANEETPKLTKVALAVLARAGIKIDNSQAGMPVDPMHKPRFEFLETQRKCEALFAPIKERHALTDREAADAAAVAAAMVIQFTAKIMDPTVGFGIAVYGFVEGAKTAPDPVQLAAG